MKLVLPFIIKKEESKYRLINILKKKDIIKLYKWNCRLSE